MPGVYPPSFRALDIVKRSNSSYGRRTSVLASVALETLPMPTCQITFGASSLDDRFDAFPDDQDNQVNQQ